MDWRTTNTTILEWVPETTFGHWKRWEKLFPIGSLLNQADPNLGFRQVDLVNPNPSNRYQHWRIAQAPVGSPAQVWNVVKIEGGYFKLLNDHNKLAIDTTSVAMVDRPVCMFQGSVAGAPIQSWTIVNVGNGYVMFINKYLNKALDLGRIAKWRRRNEQRGAQRAMMSWMAAAARHALSHRHGSPLRWRIAMTHHLPAPVRDTPHCFWTKGRNTMICQFWVLSTCEIGCLHQRSHVKEKP